MVHYQAHPIPQWLDDGFLQRLLTKLSSDKESKIVSTNITPLSKLADPFASPVFRVTVTSTSRFQQPANAERSFVFKVPAAQRGNNDTPEADGPRQLFDNEIRFYSATLEEMQRLLKHSDETVELAPRLLHYSSGADAVLVLEDLSVKAYASPPLPLSLDTTISAIFKLAQWHAASIHLQTDHHDLQYSAGIFNRRHGGDQLRFMYDNFVHFVADVQTWGDAFAVYARKLSDLVPQFHERGQAIFTAKPDGFNVLNHGNLSLKNILMRNDENGIAVKFIDFQYCVWATPAIDLFCLLHLVCSPDVRAVRRNELIQFYFAEMTRTLHRIGFLRTPPTLQQLQIELLQNGFLEVIVTACLLPFYLGGQHESLDLSAEKLPQVRQTVYANEHFRSLVKAQLPYFLHRGFLN